MVFPVGLVQNLLSAPDLFKEKCQCSTYERRNVLRTEWVTLSRNSFSREFSWYSDPQLIGFVHNSRAYSAGGINPCLEAPHFCGQFYYIAICVIAI